METTIHTVVHLDQPTRIYDYIIGRFPSIPTRSSSKKAFKKGLVHLNGKKARTSTYLKEGDIIQVLVKETPLSKPFPLELEILFEDHHLAIINKPSGIITSGNQYITIQNALPYNLEASQATDALVNPKPVHRLDGPTSGLLLVAKSKSTQVALGQMFEQRKISKTYHAIIHGKMNDMIVDSDVNGLGSKTIFKTIKVGRSLKNDYITWVQAQPLTGRMHQIRQHLAMSNHPIVGDKMYGDPENTKRDKGLFLAAVQLEFIHPITQTEINIQIETPSKFDSFFKREQRRWEKYHSTT